MKSRFSAAVAAPGLAALVLLTSACSGKTAEPAAGGAKSTGSTASDTAYKFRSCLRDHGLDVQEPKPGQDPRGMTIGSKGSQADMQKAMDACRQFSSNPSGKISQADKDKALKFAQCMRTNGYNMPDPVFDGGMAQALPMPQGAEKDKFDKADKICAAN